MTRPRPLSMGTGADVRRGRARGCAGESVTAEQLAHRHEVAELGVQSGAGPRVDDDLAGLLLGAVGVLRGRAHAGPQQRHQLGGGPAGAGIQRILLALPLQVALPVRAGGSLPR